MSALDVYVPNPESDPVVVEAHAAIVGQRITLIDEEAAVVLVQVCADIPGVRFAERCRTAFSRFETGYVHAFAAHALVRVGSYEDGRVVLDDVLAELQLARWLGDGYDTIEPPDLDRRELEVQ